MKYILIIVLTLLSFAAFSQTPQPTGLPTKLNNLWYQYTGYIDDSLGIFLPKRDTNWLPRKQAFIFRPQDSTLYFWNLHHWVQVGSPKGLFVKYGDSLTIYTTPHQLHDSLNNYVNLWGRQTVGALAYKDWLATQTFDGDSSIFNGTILNVLRTNQINNHTKSDSLDYMANSVGASNRFFVQINNPNYSYHHDITLPYSGLTVQQIRLDDHNDTVSALLGNQGASGAIVSFKNTSGSVAPTYFITNNKGGSMVAGSFGAKLLTDTALINDATKTWNFDLPISAISTYVSLPKHGTLYSFADISAGTLTLLDSIANDYTVTTRYGIKIRGLANSHLTHPYGIYQEGLNDTLYFNSKVIQTPSIGVGLTPAWYLLLDANGNWVKKSYIPQVTATLDFPSTSAQSSSELTVTVTGASVTMNVVVNSKVNPDNSCWSAYVSSANTVTIRFNNYSSGSINPASNDFEIKLFPH